jgi:acetoacetyl-CoA synthetase
VDELGELVIRQPLPSMPLYLWNDPDGSRYRNAYFDVYPGVWRHGDWLLLTRRGTCVISGRSDATLNRGGVRLGTSEFYSVVESLPEILDSLVVHLEDQTGGPGRLLLFVVTTSATPLTDSVRDKIRAELRRLLSPRHAPDEIIQVPSVPRNLTQKKLEVPIKRILQGEPVQRVVSSGSLADPSALDAFVALASTFTQETTPA